MSAACRPAAHCSRTPCIGLRPLEPSDLQEAFIDGSFAPAKQGGACVGKTKRGYGSKIMAIADRHGLPVRLIRANAYESDRLDPELARRVVELIAPHRRSLTQRTQDGRPLRRYQRRWKIERPLCLVPELSADRRAL